MVYCQSLKLCKEWVLFVNSVGCFKADIFHGKVKLTPQLFQRRPKLNCNSRSDFTSKSFWHLWKHNSCSGSSVVKLCVKCVTIIQNRLEVDMFCRATSQNNPQLFFSFFLSKKFSNGNFQNLFGGMTRAHTPRVVSEYEPQRTKTREVRAVNRCSVHFWSSRYVLIPPDRSLNHCLGYLFLKNSLRWE